MDADVVVVGAGVVGCAIAAALAPRQRVVVVERNDSYGLETTAHNSGVVHAGIYYPTGSLKHRLCVEGNRALYEWCESHSVRTRRCGKLVVALDASEEPALEALYEQARANEVPGVERISGAAARALEPAVAAIEALRSDSSGVVDALAFTRSLEAEARSHEALFAYQHELRGAEREGDGFRLELCDAEGAPSELRVGILVNAAGHGAPAIAGALGYPLDGAPEVPVLRQRVSRGRWYDIVGGEAARAVERLIYPLPDHGAGGLGVHLTVDVDGGLHLGPDSTWLEEGAALDYRADDEARAEFLASGRRLLPALRDEDIAPGQVGYRPKLQEPGAPLADFLVWQDRGYVHLGGIESPGLTCALPLGRLVAELLGESAQSQAG